ncbi:hypothetical protein O3P69_002187 [Scylla paramamosain]|uniref:Uncharacterized protein n=1 Tax=Scylla paramamosain TaxID=85552 RepID=A0AAW0V839_SCYPA
MDWSTYLFPAPSTISTPYGEADRGSTSKARGGDGSGGGMKVQEFSSSPRKSGWAADLLPPRKLPCRAHVRPVMVQRPGEVACAGSWRGWVAALLSSAGKKNVNWNL